MEKEGRERMAEEEQIEDDRGGKRKNSRGIWGKDMQNLSGGW